MNSICICGAGTMGSGIAQVAAGAGFRTILYDVNEEMIAKAKVKMEKDLQALVEKAKISEGQKGEILGYITFTSKVEDCVADVIIEAIIESLDAKASLFNRLA